jgi:uncharacterized protein
MTTTDNAIENPIENPLASFAKCRVWAVVGVSDNQEKYGNIIYQDLRDSGYTVYGINPKLSQIEGDVCYPNLAALPVIPEVVNLVVPPAVTESVIDECIKLGVTRVWFQPGAEHDGAIAKADAAGLTVVANACIMLEKISH